MGTDKNSLKGLSPEQLDSQTKNNEQKQESQGADPIDRAFDKKKAQSNESPPKSEEPKAEPKQDANDDQPKDDNSEKYKNVLVNTFGYSEDEIRDKDLKIAKSYLESQSLSTKARQQMLEAQETIDGIKSVFQKAPTLYEQMKAVAEGKQPENLTPENRKQDNSDQKGQLDNNSTVDERTLIDNGYLNQQELENLDELARQRKIASAELKFEKDKMLQEYRQGLTQTQQELQQQTQQEQAQKLNAQRVDNGFDQYITKYGVNFNEVTDDQFNQIKQHAKYIRDPQNPNLISEDAIEIAANRVLGKPMAQQQQPEQRKSVDNLVDTGRSISRSRQPQNQGEDDLETQLRKRAIENFQNTSNPKRFKQHLTG